MRHGEKAFFNQVRCQLRLEHFCKHGLGAKRVSHCQRFHGVRHELTGQLDRPRYGQAVVGQGYSAAKPGESRRKHTLEHTCISAILATISVASTAMVFFLNATRYLGTYLSVKIIVSAKGNRSFCEQARRGCGHREEIRW